MFHVPLTGNRRRHSALFFSDLTLRSSIRSLQNGLFYLAFLNRFWLVRRQDRQHECYCLVRIHVHGTKFALRQPDFRLSNRSGQCLLFYAGTQTNGTDELGAI
jgi:hypothetical protein